MADGQAAEERCLTTMKNAVDFLTGNHVLNVTFFAFLTAQVLKIVTVLITKKKLDFRRLVGSGGMPSSHAATVSCLAAAVGKSEGTASIAFAISVVFAVIVMYDASNVRRAAGDQAKILNYMMEHWNKSTPALFGKELKELLGHTPVEVFIGSLLGIAFGLIL